MERLSRHFVALPRQNVNKRGMLNAYARLGNTTVASPGVAIP